MRACVRVYVYVYRKCASLPLLTPVSSPVPSFLPARSDELKELVKVSLQQAGVLGSIKAQLRAEVFKVVNNEQAGAGVPPAKLAALASSEGQVRGVSCSSCGCSAIARISVVVGAGATSCILTANVSLPVFQVAADLVREFLEHFQLHSTLAVFVPEANQENSYPGRAQLAQRLGIDADAGLPLLMAMMRQGGGAGRAGLAPAPATSRQAESSGPQGRSPARGSTQSQSAPADSKFAFGGADKGSLSDASPLPGAGKKGGDTSAENDSMSERVRKLQSLAQEGGERRSPQAENESDESLTRCRPLSFCPAGHSPSSACDVHVALTVFSPDSSPPQHNAETLRGPT